MTPRSPDDPPHGDPSPPRPPYSAEQLADLHAGIYPEHIAAHMYSQISDDPAAQRVLAALDATRDRLRNAPIEPVEVPDHVRERTARTLDALSGRTDIPTTPNPTDGGAPVRPRSPALLLAAAAVLLVVVAASVLLVLRMTADTGTDPTVAEPSNTDALAPLPDSEALFAVLGRTDGAPFDSPVALRRCTAANDVPPNTPVVGSGPIDLDGQAAAVILLGTGQAGRFDALVVGRDCGTGKPSLISRRIIGGG